MKITTADCKIFITTFLKSNPDIMVTLYGLTEPEEIQEMMDLVTDKANWRRMAKRKPDEDDANVWNEYLVNIYVDGKKPNHFAETTGTVKTNDVLWVREFKCGKDTDIGFLVIEMRDGTIHLGEHRD